MRMNKGNKYYIRFGEIPENEISGIYHNEVCVGYEKGVSVYEAQFLEGQWRVVLPYPMKHEVGFDLYGIISMIENNQIKAYLVQGDVVGSGTTNEPVLKNVKIVKELWTRKNLR